MKTNKIKKLYGKIVVGVAKKITSFEVNAACVFITYQPTIPESAKMLRKFE